MRVLLAKGEFIPFLNHANAILTGVGFNTGKLVVS